MGDEEQEPQSSAQQLVTKAFGHCDLYAIFHVQATASAEEIKKAYRKLALKHHPDRGGNKETFQALSVVHSILSDDEKRKIYDDTGSLDDDDGGLTDNDHSFAFWNDYFRALFPKLTISKIENFAKTYIGSEEERQDILEAYQQRKGDLDEMMEFIMFAEEGHEARICAVVDAAIEKKEVKMFPKYKTSRVNEENPRGRGNRRQPVKHHNCDEDEAEPEAAGGAKKRGSKAKSASDGLEDLVKAIRHNRHTQSKSMWSHVMDKYGVEGQPQEPDIDDEAFEALRSKVTSNKKQKIETKPAKPAAKKKS